jgi:hypothetical protein
MQRGPMATVLNLWARQHDEAVPRKKSVHIKFVAFMEAEAEGTLAWSMLGSTEL